MKTNKILINKFYIGYYAYDYTYVIDYIEGFNEEEKEFIIFSKESTEKNVERWSYSYEELINDVYSYREISPLEIMLHSSEIEEIIYLRNFYRKNDIIYEI